jgi:hypothetical protein
MGDGLDGRQKRSRDSERTREPERKDTRQEMAERNQKQEERNDGRTNEWMKVDAGKGNESW